MMIKTGLILFAAGMALGGAGAWQWSRQAAAAPAPAAGAPAPNPPRSAPVNDNAGETRRNAIVAAIEKAAPAVAFVSVTQERLVSPFFTDPFFRQFFPPRVEVNRSMGSGVLLNPQGYLVTNYHVIEGGSQITVLLPDGRRFHAEVAGADPYTDMAVLRIHGKDLPFITLAEPGDLLIGEWAIAIGNPFGGYMQDAKPTVTVGVISAVDREFRPEAGIGYKARYKHMIQTDASINPGNSGGALVNARGQLVGLNTFILSPQGGTVGINFAIPVYKVKKILMEVMQYGKVRRFWTGLTVQDLTPPLAASLGLADTAGGVVVSQVAAKSPAAAAGVRRGDVVTGVDKYGIANEESIQDVMVDYFVGDTLTLGLVRDGKARKVRMVLTESE